MMSEQIRNRRERVRNDIANSAVANLPPEMLGCAVATETLLHQRSGGSGVLELLELKLGSHHPQAWAGGRRVYLTWGAWRGSGVLALLCHTWFVGVEGQEVGKGLAEGEVVAAAPGERNVLQPQPQVSLVRTHSRGSGQDTQQRVRTGHTAGQAEGQDRTHSTASSTWHSRQRDVNESENVVLSVTHLELFQSPLQGKRMFYGFTSA